MSIKDLIRKTILPRRSIPKLPPAIRQPFLFKPRPQPRAKPFVPFKLKPRPKRLAPIKVLKAKRIGKIKEGLKLKRKIKKSKLIGAVTFPKRKRIVIKPRGTPFG